MSVFDILRAMPSGGLFRVEAGGGLNSEMERQMQSPCFHPSAGLAKPEAEAVYAGMLDAALRIALAGNSVSSEDLRRCGYSHGEIEQHAERLFRHLLLALENLCCGQGGREVCR